MAATFKTKVEHCSKGSHKSQRSMNFVMRARQEAKPLLNKDAPRDGRASTVHPILNRRFITHALMLLLALLCVEQSASAQSLSVTPTTFNVVGLDSNNVNSGPNVYPVGARACNTSGVVANNVVANFVWDSSNININLNSSNTITVASLAPGACTEFFFDVAISRTSAAYLAARRYHITVSATGVAPVSTPSPREIFVEKIVSQRRNSVDAVIGPTTVYIGRTYTYTLDASTAPGGYEQLETFLSLPSSMFQVLSVNATYTAPAGGTNDKIYADACGWDNNPLSPSYRSCIGPANYAGGKAGGTIRTTYTVKVVAAGSATVAATIFDFSGSSYHYTSGGTILSVTALPPPTPNIALDKSVNTTDPQPPGADLTYTITFTNSGTGGAASFVITDTIPANTDFKINSPAASLGTTGLSVTVQYSNDGGMTYTYTPASAAGGAPAGYDRLVTHVRWVFTGTLSQVAPNNTGSVVFTVRIR